MHMHVHTINTHNRVYYIDNVKINHYAKKNISHLEPTKNVTPKLDFNGKEFPTSDKTQEASPR